MPLDQTGEWREPGKRNLILTIRGPDTRRANLLRLGLLPLSLWLAAMLLCWMGLWG